MPLFRASRSAIAALSACALAVGVHAADPPATAPDRSPDAAPARVAEPSGSASSRARNSEPTLEPPPADIPPRDSWFPHALRPLQPYLQLANRFGTNALKPGAVIASDPVSDAAQALKDQLAKIGVRYSFDQ